MERIDYSQLIQKILTEHSVNNGKNNTEIQLLFDTKRHHYQVLNIGWKEQKRIYGVIIHVDLRDNKIWIQRDGTEIGIANQLITAGVPKKDIVLGFYAPYKRSLTEFAVS
ncbi:MULTISPECIES: XisI protein [Okeania]|uniref:XisI protein n=1 Tax=Okeania hirsuta TaxID=1458930 RepID=A0A3N6N8M3_9CYAN|nr:MULTISPECIES: XisI protein [Okeania]NET13308.1 XisI protein [Okeania sp. SIO1H6]NES78196.1 XisI protein [Okeania sp. SIO1H4]NES91870.1 XisI protein [Okeania sp. SIO2B9]NET18742.1 XisI protein [Okeania sp. SIO1H5]NET78345.1 XisI protein [Okeania sp. SIO1F9]